MTAAKTRWFNVTYKDGTSLRVQAETKENAISRATVHAFRNKKEWIVESANPTKVEPMPLLPIDDAQLTLDNAA